MNLSNEVVENHEQLHLFLKDVIADIENLHTVITELVADHETSRDAVAEIITNFNTLRNNLAGDYLDSTAALAIGSSKPNVATGAFEFHVNGIEYQKAAVAAGTALSGDNLPTAKSGAWALDIGADGTIDITPAADNATGYADAATAAAAIPAVAADHVRLGYVTVDNASGGDFDPGTTDLDAVGLTVVYTDATLSSQLPAALAESAPASLTASVQTLNVGEVS